MLFALAFLVVFFGYVSAEDHPVVMDINDLPFTVSSLPIKVSSHPRWPEPIIYPVADSLDAVAILGSMDPLNTSRADLLFVMQTYCSLNSTHPEQVWNATFPLTSAAGNPHGDVSDYLIREGYLMAFYGRVRMEIIQLKPAVLKSGGSGAYYPNASFVGHYAERAQVRGEWMAALTAKTMSIATDVNSVGGIHACNNLTYRADFYRCQYLNVTVFDMTQLFVGGPGDPSAVLHFSFMELPVLTDPNHQLNIIGILDVGYLLLWGSSLQLLFSSFSGFDPIVINYKRNYQFKYRYSWTAMNGAFLAFSHQAPDSFDDYVVYQMWLMWPTGIQNQWSRTQPGVWSPEDPHRVSGERLTNDAFLITVAACIRAGYSIQLISLIDGSDMWDGPQLWYYPLHYVGVTTTDNTNVAAFMTKPAIENPTTLIMIDVATGTMLDSTVNASQVYAGEKILFAMQGRTIAGISLTSIDGFELPEFVTAVTPSAERGLWVTGGSRLQLINFPVTDAKLCWRSDNGTVAPSASHQPVSTLDGVHILSSATETLTFVESNGHVVQCYAPTYLMNPMFMDSAQRCFPEGGAVASSLRWSGGLNDTVSFPVMFKDKARVLTTEQCAIASDFHKIPLFKQCVTTPGLTGTIGPTLPVASLGREGFVKTSNLNAKAKNALIRWQEKTFELGASFSIRQLWVPQSSGESSYGLDRCDRVAVGCVVNSFDRNTSLTELCDGVREVALRYFWCSSAWGSTFVNPDDREFSYQLLAMFAKRVGQHLAGVCDVVNATMSLYREDALSFRSDGVSLQLVANHVKRPCLRNGSNSASGQQQLCPTVLSFWSGDEEVLGEESTTLPVGYERYNLTAQFTACGIGFYGFHPTPFSIGIIGAVLSAIVTVASNVLLERWKKLRGIRNWLLTSLIMMVFPMELARTTMSYTPSRHRTKFHFRRIVRDFLTDDRVYNRTHYLQVFDRICDELESHVKMDKGRGLTTEEKHALDNFFWTTFTQNGTQLPVFDDVKNDSFLKRSMDSDEKAASPTVANNGGSALRLRKVNTGGLRRVNSSNSVSSPSQPVSARGPRPPNGSPLDQEQPPAAATASTSSLTVLERCVLAFFVVIDTHLETFSDAPGSTTLTHFGGFQPFTSPIAGDTLGLPDSEMKTLSQQSSKRSVESDEREPVSAGNINNSEVYSAQTPRGANDESQQSFAKRVSPTHAANVDESYASSAEEKRVMAETRLQQAHAQSLYDHIESELQASVVAFDFPTTGSETKMFADNGVTEGSPSAYSRATSNRQIDDEVPAILADEYDTASFREGRRSQQGSGKLNPRESDQHLDEEEPLATITINADGSSGDPMSPLLAIPQSDRLRGRFTQLQAVGLLMIGIPFKSSLKVHAFWITEMAFSKSIYVMLFTFFQSTVYFIFALVESLLHCRSCSHWVRYQLFYFQLVDSGIVPNLVVAAFLRGLVLGWDRISAILFLLSLFYIAGGLFTHILPGLAIGAPITVPLLLVALFGIRLLSWLAKLPTLPQHYLDRLNRHRFLRVFLFADLAANATNERETPSRTVVFLRYLTRLLARILIVTVISGAIQFSFAASTWFYSGVEWQEIVPHDDASRRIGCTLEKLFEKTFSIVSGSAVASAFLV